MKRIIVIGCPGSGKSTFARKLKDLTGLPLHYLDMIWHKPDKTNVAREEFDSKLDDILAEECWIIDGNYQRTMERRMEKCDTVFLLDYPTEICLEGAEMRIGQKREDMPWVEDEFDEEFRQWIMEFSENTLPKIYEMLQKYGDGRNIVIFKSRKDADEFLRGMGNGINLE